MITTKIMDQFHTLTEGMTDLEKYMVAQNLHNRLKKESDKYKKVAIGSVEDSFTKHGIVAKKTLSPKYVLKDGVDANAMMDKYPDAVKRSLDTKLLYEVAESPKELLDKVIVESVRITEQKIDF